MDFPGTGMVGFKLQPALAIINNNALYTQVKETRISAKKSSGNLSMHIYNYLKQMAKIIF